jgi:BASS family bile acid:Na+ symporter
MKSIWILTLLLLMVGVGMSLDPAEVIARWRRLPRVYWLKVVAATYVLPPLLAMAIVAILPLTPEIKGGVLILSIAPGAPMLTRMVAQKGYVFDARLAASYQILVGVLVPLLTPPLLHALGSFYHRDVWISPSTLAIQVASLQFLPLAAGLALKHYQPEFCARAGPWMSRLGNLLLIVYLGIILFGLRKALLAAGPLAAGTGALFAIGCMAAGHLLGGPTIALSNANRHVGLAMLIVGLNFSADVKRFVPFLAAYALLTPVLMTLYAILQKRREKARPGRT